MRLLGAFGAVMVVGLILTGCPEPLRFDNEFDPQAANSPLGVTVTGEYLFAYMNGTSKDVDIGWNRIDEAIEYEYQVVPVFWREESPDAAFAAAEAGDRPFLAQGTIPQLTNNPFATITGAWDSVFALRVRYSAQASNAGVTNVDWSPWSDAALREAGTPLYFYPTRDLAEGETFADNFDFRGDRFIFIVDATGFAGATMNMYIEDEWSGLPNGADPQVRVYDQEFSFDGPFVEYSNPDYDKTQFPLGATVPTSEQLYILMESDNPDVTNFTIRIDFRF